MLTKEESLHTAVGKDAISIPICSIHFMQFKGPSLVKMTSKKIAIAGKH
jgi:hypothetical protein